MASVLGVGTACGISNHGDQTLKQHASGSGLLNIRQILDSFRKFVFASIPNFSSKPIKGNVQFYETVHELVHRPSLKPCDHDKEKPGKESSEEDMQAKIEKMQEEMNIAKDKIVASSEKMKAVSSNKSPPEQLKEKHFLMPTKKRITIRSRL